MLKFSKKLEYSLIALRHFADNTEEVVKVRDISERYNIPHELLAKILQKLKKENILESIQGTNGGYKLLKSLQDISLNELYNALEENRNLVECMNDDNSDCFVSDNCTIKSPINKMQMEFESLLKNKRISDFI